MSVTHMVDIKIVVTDDSIARTGSYDAAAMMGETIGYQVGHDDTVASIKAHIAEDFAADPSQIDLAFNGYDCVDDTETTASLGVKNNSTIECAIVRGRKPSRSLASLVGSTLESKESGGGNALESTKCTVCGLPLVAVVANVALLTTQIIFGIGSVVGKVGISAHNPVLFALVREGCAGPILVLMAFALTREVPRIRDAPVFLVAGLAIFANQLGYIVGLSLTDATTGSAWQPTQPIFVSIIAMALQMERFSFLKVLGVLVGFAGCAFMCLFGQSLAEVSKVYILGNVCFFVNCFGTAVYILVSKLILSRCKCNKPGLEARVATCVTIAGPHKLCAKARSASEISSAPTTYSSITVTGWSYVVASVLMLITTLVVNNVPPALAFVCTSKVRRRSLFVAHLVFCLHSRRGAAEYVVGARASCAPPHPLAPSLPLAPQSKNATAAEGQCEANAWKVPLDMLLPLLYWIVFNSVAAYALMTWANKHVNTSVTSIYTVLQPLTSAVLSTLLLLLLPKWGKSKGLLMPGWNALGVIGIALGLACVLFANSAERKRAQRTAPNEQALLGAA